MDNIDFKSLIESNPIFICQLNGRGGKRDVTMETLPVNKNPCWVHLDYHSKQSAEWIDSSPMFPDFVKERLKDRDTTPRCIRFDDGILVVLRGVNITPNTLPDPVITLRFYITSDLIISTRHHLVDSIMDIWTDLTKGIGPLDAADWLIDVSDTITDYATIAIDSLQARVISLERKVISRQQIDYRELGDVRQQVVVLRRYLSPQRSIFTKLSTERVSWIDENDRQHIHDVSLRLNHCIEDLDSCFARLTGVLSQANALLTEITNRRLYIMALITMIFMPITFLTSLLGVNLGGVPGNGSSWAFAVLVIIIVIISVISAIWFKRKKWL